jgi:hypothetical protein
MSNEQTTHREHPVLDDCDLVYEGHIAAPGYGVAYHCRSCGRPWVKVGTRYIDPRESVIELSPEDVR